jgi:hypothetical protein
MFCHLNLRRRINVFEYIYFKIMVLDFKQLYIASFILGIFGGLGGFFEFDILVVAAGLGCIVIATYLWHQDLKDQKRISDRDKRFRLCRIPQ